MGEVVYLLWSRQPHHATLHGIVQTEDEAETWRRQDRHTGYGTESWWERWEVGKTGQGRVECSPAAAAFSMPVC